MSDDAAKRRFAKRLMLAFVVSLAVIVFVFSRGETKPDWDYIAYTECKAAIAKHSVNPSAAKIPRVLGAELQAGGMAHIWKPTDGLLLQNAMGAMVQTPAGCRTSPNGEVVWLKIGDTVVIW